MYLAKETTGNKNVAKILSRTSSEGLRTKVKEQVEIPEYRVSQWKREEEEEWKKEQDKNQIQKAMKNSVYLRKELKAEIYQEKSYSSFANPPSRRINRCHSALEHQQNLKDQEDSYTNSVKDFASPDKRQTLHKKSPSENTKLISLKFIKDR